MMRLIPLAVVVALLNPLAAHGESIAISGHELFPGLALGETTTGVIFAGWTTAPGVQWRSPSLAGDIPGGWFASISYRGEARQAGARVSVTGGTWTVSASEMAGGYSGRVLDGTVTWPGRLASAIWSCWDPSGQYPVARIDVVLTSKDTMRSARFHGCLDDIHWQPARPLQDVPKVWGRLHVEAGSGDMLKVRRWHPSAGTD